MGVDTTNPIIQNCPSDITQGVANAAATAVVTWTPPTATDNITPDNLITTVATHSPGGSFGVGTTAVSYVFTDQAGNDATCSFNVNVLGKYRMSTTTTKF